MSNRHFEERGDDYARYRPTYPARLAEVLAGLVEHRGLAVDVGCGNGQFSVLLAAHFDRVHASDVSKTQIENAPARANISYTTGSAEMLEVADKSADLITAAQAAHWFDLPAFYEEVRRAGKPGSVIALITYGMLGADGPGKDRIDQFYWQEIHPFWPEGRQHVETAYRDFAFPFEQIETPALDIERNWSAAAFLNYCLTWSSVKRADKAGRSDILDAFEADLMALMPEGATMRVTWPISIRCGRLV